MRVTPPDNRVEFRLSCMSLNGMLLNGGLLSKGAEERRLEHGDVVALSVNTDVASGSSALPRKPFLAFVFELRGAPPPKLPWESDELLKLPEGTVAGRWWTHAADASAAKLPEDALFCLEV